MSDALTGDYSFENGIKILLGKEFGGMASGFNVRWEAKQYRPSKFTDVRLWDVKGQATGKLPKIAEIFWHGQYLCDVSEDMTPEQVKQRITEFLTVKIAKGGV